MLVIQLNLAQSEDKKRLMLGWEQLHVLGYPVWKPGAAAAKVDS